MDKNIPLEGDQSAIGRSIVIFGPNQSSERFSCANIEPDHDIIKYVNLQRPPKFVVYVLYLLFKSQLCLSILCNYSFTVELNS